MKGRTKVLYGVSVFFAVSAISYGLPALIPAAIFYFLARRSTKKHADTNKTDDRSPNREVEQKKARIREKELAFNEVLNAIPRVDILPSKEVEQRARISLPEVKFTNITTRTNPTTIANCTVIDVETTGLSAMRDEIVEISAMRFEDFEPVSLFHTLIKPKKPISGASTAIHGITDEMVSAAPEFGSIVSQLEEFIGKSNLVGHNIEFDLKFLCANGVDIFGQTRRYYDTLSLARSQLRKYKDSDDFLKPYDVFDYKLTTVARYYDIYRDDAHRSASDCLATGLVFNNLVAKKVDTAVRFRHV